MTASLEAVERLVEAGWAPDGGDVLLAFGYDEEISGLMVRCCAASSHFEN